VREDLAKLDRDRLQGTWTFVSGNREAQLAIADDHFTVSFKNGAVYLGTFRLDPTHKPKAMDMLIVEGPEGKGQTALAIYALDGDHLIWCPAKPGAAERPRYFPPAENKEPLCIVFHRVK
jgi:uncharacterized protein (TIGR03067 family)